MSNPIGWCTDTWNPIVGCSPVSSGCDHCYAERMASRFSAYGEPFQDLISGTYSKHRWSGMTQFKPERLEQPFHWRKPRRVFVCSMGDLFHESVTNDQIAAIFGVIAACQQHTFMLLTKRPERALEWFQWLEKMSQSPYDHEYETYLEIGAIFRKPLPNLWIGVSVEDARFLKRVARLWEIPASKKFVSYEPAIGWMSLDPGYLRFLDLVICGAETGPHKRPMDLDWARSVRDRCAASVVPFWFKKDSDGNETLDGVTHHPEFINEPKTKKRSKKKAQF